MSISLDMYNVLNMVYILVSDYNLIKNPDKDLKIAVLLLVQQWIVFTEF